jgi:hypothetical protein
MTYVDMFSVFTRALLAKPFMDEPAKYREAFMHVIPAP